MKKYNNTLKSLQTFIILQGHQIPLYGNAEDWGKIPLLNFSEINFYSY